MQTALELGPNREWTAMRTFLDGSLTVYLSLLPVNLYLYHKSTPENNFSLQNKLTHYLEPKSTLEGLQQTV